MNSLRFLAMLILGQFALQAIPIAAAESPFPDVPMTSPYGGAIRTLRDEGVIQGNPDGTFRPSNGINRAEFLKIVLLSRPTSLKLRGAGGEIDANAKACFPDVQDQWFASVVCTAKAEGIVSGYPDGLFRPEQDVNVAEAGKILTLAFKEPVSLWSPDWYEPYLRALESGNAIPVSIDRLDAPLKRDEMAEMMWRLSHDVTDRESKAYLNVKYPEMQVNLASATPQTAVGCADLEAFSREAARSGGMMMQRSLGQVAAPSVAEDAVTSQKSYSETNVQVQGVDEADIVKTDGTYLYAITDGSVRIVRATPPSSLELLATLSFTDGSFSPNDLYVEDGRLVLIGTAAAQGPQPLTDDLPQTKMFWPGPWWNMQRSEARIYTLADHKKPVLERTVSFDGSVVSTRRIDNRFILVLNQPVQPWGNVMPTDQGGGPSSIVPTFRDSAAGSEDTPVAPCDKVMILPRIPSPQYLTVATFDTTRPADEVKRSVVLGSAENIYASLDNLYVAAGETRYFWNPAAVEKYEQQTRLYRFSLGGNGISFQAQGLVPGRVLNQFSMDEHEGNFRIATTKDEQWIGDEKPLPSSNNLLILNRNMELIGSIKDIAPGEQIYSARFIGDRAYMVTFRRIDPFFVIDTSDPRSPKILGKLKIPGYSDYLHPYDENHIIGFGKEAVESKEGDFAWYQGMKVALFDVTDVADPKEMHRLVIGDRGTESPLLHDHKALLFDRDRNLLAFPISIFTLTDAQKQTGDPQSAWGQQTFQGAYVYDISLQDGFQFRGSVTHYSADDLLKSGGYLYGKDIQRIVRIADSLVTLSSAGVQSHGEGDVKLEGSLSFRTLPEGASCPSDSEANYVSKDPDECMRMRFFCAEGMEAFSNSCGCGCMPQ